MKRDSRLSMSLHLLLHMAEHAAPVTSEFLGSRMRTHPVVIRRTLAGLRNAGLVGSAKGHGGGWTLARGLRTISLLDIYRALGEPVLIQQERVIDPPECRVERKVAETLDATFREAENLVLRRFERMKLSDLLDEYHAQAKKSGRERKERKTP